MAPLEPHEKVLVKQSFLRTEHGGIDCIKCHGGNREAADMQGGHTGLQADPTFPDASESCGPCHEEPARLAKTSLHYTLATYKPMLHRRAAQDTAKLSMLDKGMDYHCYSCHASCGGCHVSRPDSAGGGFIDGHAFNRKPDQTNQCTACHGSRVGNEFTGETGLGDVHYTKHDMDCMDCHTAKDMHGDGRSGHKDRYDVEGLSQCSDCHDPEPGIEQHDIHGDKLSCQVCHAQPYANCFGCHVGLDGRGLAYFKNPEEKELLRIGLNPAPDSDRPEKWIIVRRVPVVEDSFEYYGTDLLTRFGELNNWKYSSPHNIQRITAQNRECNNCHGNEDIFLTSEKVLPGMRKSNGSIIVPDTMIPGKRDIPESETKPVKKKRSYF